MWWALGSNPQLGCPCNLLLMLPHLGLGQQGQQQPQKEEEEEVGTTHPQEVEMSQWCHEENLQGERQ